MKLNLSSLKLILLVVFLAGATILAAGTSTWRVGQSDVRATCSMTVGGNFEAKTSALSGSVTAGAGDSPTLDGSLGVDLRTLDTGIGLRNDHLRKEYLEVDKGPGYESATLSEIQLKGVSPAAPAGKGSFSGSLTLHGVKKAVTGPVEVRNAGGDLRVKASFPVNLPDYGIAEPRYLGVGVKDIVQVEVAFTVKQ
jgi:polyisoprenoid-binding protein YceI